jgi:hypothetical protein
MNKYKLSGGYSPTLEDKQLIILILAYSEYIELNENKKYDIKKNDSILRSIVNVLINREYLTLNDFCEDVHTVQFKHIITHDIEVGLTGASRTRHISNVPFNILGDIVKIDKTKNLNNKLFLVIDSIIKDIDLSGMSELNELLHIIIRQKILNLFKYVIENAKNNTFLKIGAISNNPLDLSNKMLTQEGKILEKINEAVFNCYTPSLQCLMFQRKCGKETFGDRIKIHYKTPLHSSFSKKNLHEYFENQYKMKLSILNLNENIPLNTKPSINNYQTSNRWHSQTNPINSTTTFKELQITSSEHIEGDSWNQFINKHHSGTISDENFYKTFILLVYNFGVMSKLGIVHSDGHAENQMVFEIYPIDIIIIIKDDLAIQLTNVKYIPVIIDWDRGYDLDTSNLDFDFFEYYYSKEGWLVTPPLDMTIQWNIGNPTIEPVKPLTTTHPVGGFDLINRTQSQDKKIDFILFMIFIYFFYWRYHDNTLAFITNNYWINNNPINDNTLEKYIPEIENCIYHGSKDFGNAILSKYLGSQRTVLNNPQFLSATDYLIKLKESKINHGFLSTINSIKFVSTNSITGINKNTKIYFFSDVDVTILRSKINNSLSGWNDLTLLEKSLVCHPIINDDDIKNNNPINQLFGTTINNITNINISIKNANKKLKKITSIQSELETKLYDKDKLSSENIEKYTIRLQQINKLLFKYKKVTMSLVKLLNSILMEKLYTK